MLAGLVCAGLVLSGAAALAQNNSTAGPQMVYGVPQIIRLSQATVSDDTIIAYVKNSGLSYSLTADQIINLRQQGVSDAVITAMLNQPKTETSAYTPTASAPHWWLRATVQTRLTQRRFTAHAKAIKTRLRPPALNQFQRPPQHRV